MYSYGPGAQSVYGREFGPPSIPPFRPGMGMGMNMGMGMGMGYPPNVPANYSQPPFDPNATYSNPMPPSRSSQYLPSSRPSQRPSGAISQYGSPRRREIDLDYTPPPGATGLINSIPDSPRRASAGRSRSSLGMSRSRENLASASASGSAGAQAPKPPTSWRKSSLSPARGLEREDARTPGDKRYSKQIIN